MSTRRGRHALAALGLLVATALAVTGCTAGASPKPTASASTGVARTDATLRLGLAASPANLDFTTTGGAAIFQALLGNVYEGLLQLDSKRQLTPLLATGYTVSRDGLTYDFTLREGVKFSDGSPFDAAAVKFSLERVKTWKANTPGNLAALDHVEVVSPTEVKLVLSAPDATVPFWLAGPLGAMFSPTAVGSLATKAVGTGPFTVASYQTGVKLVLARNDAYWGAKALVKQVDLDYFADASAAANAMRSGGVDALYQSEAYDQLASFANDPRFVVTTGSTQGVVVLSMNEANPALADVRVRQAISHAIDKKAVVAAATGGFATELNGPAVPTDPYYVRSDEPYPYDPSKAKQLLADAGVTGLNLTFTVPNRPYAQAISQVVQSDLAAVGITATLQTQEFPAVWVDKTLTQHQFDLTVVNHVEPRNVTNYGNPSYYWSYSNPVVEKDFAAAKAATDEDSYITHMTDAVQTIIKDAAGVWLYNPPNVVVSTAAVHGMPTNDLGVGIGLAGVSVTG